MKAIGARIAGEKDRDSFILLVQELNDLLDNKEHRLERASSEPDSSKRKGERHFSSVPSLRLLQPLPN
jgi:hypothetical protein